MRMASLAWGLTSSPFANKLEVNDHPSVIYGNRVSRMLFDQYLALEGSFVK